MSLKDRLVRTAVQRAVQGVDAGGDGREQVRLRRADEAHGGGGGVLLVVLVEDEQPLQRPREHRIHFVGLRQRSEVEPQEVVDEAERVVRVEERLADALLVGVGSDHRELRQEADGRELDLLRIVHTERVLVEGRQSGHRTGEHRHRVGIVRQCAEEAAQVFVEEGVTADALVEVCEFGRSRQLAMDEEPGHLEEGGVLGDLLDRVAAIAQDAGIAVDVGDRGPRGRGVHEPVVEAREPGLAGQAGEVDARRALRARQDRELRHAPRIAQRGDRRFAGGAVLLRLCLLDAESAHNASWMG
jgi:hypothetical protein